jgi:hypothetical protein
MRELQATKETCGVSRINAGDSNIPGNNCPGSDHNLIADCYRENSSVCADTYTIAKFSWAPKVWLPGRATFADQVVNEHCAVRNEAILPDRNQFANRNEFADERVGLNATPLTDSYASLYVNEGSNEAASPMMHS